jgi:chromosome segregation ATPase
MAQRNFRASVRMDENVLELSRPSPHDAGAEALELVYQAADVFRSIEERARDFEARAQAAEQAQRELIVDTERKLQDASKALEQARSRLAAQQDRLTAIEFRAQAAEAEAREAKQALALVEEAIRRRLLFTRSDFGGASAAVT